MAEKTQELTVDVIRERIKTIRSLPLDRNTFYRDAPVASYALYGTGPLYGLSRGARYSPPDHFPVLYFAADRLLAQLEAAHHLNRLMPKDVTSQVRELHESLSSSKAQRLSKILSEMATTDEGYEKSPELLEYLQIPIVKDIFEQDPARLLVFLEQKPNFGFSLRAAMDSGRISIAARISTRGVLDLTNEEVLGKLGIENSDLLQPTESWQGSTKSALSITERIGLAAWDAPGIDGILAPTALPNSEQSSLVLTPYNLVLFMHENEPHRPRSASVQIEIEDDFVNLTKLFWVHRPKWLLDALDRHEPDAARVLKRMGR